MINGLYLQFKQFLLILSHWCLSNQQFSHVKKCFLFIFKWPLLAHSAATTLKKKEEKNGAVRQLVHLLVYILLIHDMNLKL